MMYASMLVTFIPGSCRGSRELATDSVQYGLGADHAPVMCSADTPTAHPAEGSYERSWLPFWASCHQ
jgi:hypothetical protein